MPHCEFGLACTNTSKSLQTWHGSCFKFLSVTGVRFCNLTIWLGAVWSAHTSPIIPIHEIFWDPSISKLFDIIWHHYHHHFPNHPFFKAWLHTASVEEAQKSSVAQTWISWESQAVQLSVSPFFSANSFLLSNFLTAALLQRHCRNRNDGKWKNRKI